MKKYFSTTLICAMFSLMSCNKDRNQIIFFDFSNQSDLEEWNVFGDGNTLIDNGIITFSNISSCYHLDLKELIDVKRNRSYKIKIRSKHNPPQIGDPVYCVGSMMIWVKQDGEDLMMEGANSGDDYIDQQFTFKTNSSSPIQFKIMIGTPNGAWIDNISIEKI